jgi:hypothetical protein
MPDRKGLFQANKVEPASWQKVRNVAIRGRWAVDVHSHPYARTAAEVDRWMYEPMDPTNDGLMNAYNWRIQKGPGILGHDEIVATLGRAVKKHPDTTFIACHLANCCYDLSILGNMLQTDQVSLQTAQRFVLTRWSLRPRSQGT